MPIFFFLWFHLLTPILGMCSSNIDCVEAVECVVDCSSDSCLKGIPTLIQDPCPPYLPATILIYRDFIFFQATADSLRYAETNTFSFSSPGRSVSPDFQYEFGSRVGILFPLSYDAWSLSFIFTFHHAHPDKTIVEDPNQFLFAGMQSIGSFLSGLSNVQCGYVSGDWRLNLYVGDIEFAKPYGVGESLILRPFFGIKGSYLNQKLNVKYDNFYIVQSNLEYANKVIGRSKVWGVGPAIGLGITMSLPRGVDFFVKGAASLMFGKFNLTTKYTDLINPVAGPSNEILDRFSRGFSATQLQAGIEKEWEFGSRRYVGVSLGWEAQHWSRQMRTNFFSTIATPPEGGDLTLQGPFFNIFLVI